MGETKQTKMRLEPGGPMHVYGFTNAGDGGPSLVRPCVDCGLMTGSFCENDCSAAGWMPNEAWRGNQITPHCTHCEHKFLFCHYCRGVSMATPFAWRPKQPKEEPKPE